MQKENDWIVLRKLYAEQTRTSETIVELLSVFFILKYCAQGYCNSYIAKRLLIPVDFVEYALVEHLNTPGWESNLQFSPVGLYNKTGGRFCEYKQECIYYGISEYDMIISYNIASNYLKVARVLEDYGR